MALNQDNLVIGAANDGNSNAPRIHTYKSEDAHTSIDGDGYFDAIASKLRLGDLIYHCEVANQGESNEAVSDAQFLVVTGISAAGVVSISAETAVVVADP